MNDYVVIGAGLIGMLTARELCEAGASVTLIDQNAGGRESSWAGGGILSPLYPWRYPEPVTILSRWSQAHYGDLCAALADATGIDPEWTGNGLMMVDVDAEEHRQAFAWAERFGYRLEVLDASAMRQLEPGLGRGNSALWLSGVAQVRNPRLLKALRADLERRGVRWLLERKVTGFSEEGTRIAAVRTDGGLEPADNVIVAGGAWSGQILASTGLNLPIEPVRGQMLLFRGAPGRVQRIVLADGRYVIPRRDGRILVGSTMERVGFDKVTTEAAFADLNSAAEAIIPALAELPVEAHWAGLRPGSPDGVPFIGRHPAFANLYVNAGHFRNGVVMGLASARFAADLILGRQPCVEASPFRPLLGSADVR